MPGQSTDEGNVAFSRMRPEKFAHFQLHPIQFSEESAGGEAVVVGICLGLAQLLDLTLEALDALERAPIFVFVVNHVAVTSTMPRRVPSRLICQSSMAACSPPSAPARRTQKILAPS